MDVNTHLIPHPNVLAIQKFCTMECIDHINMICFNRLSVALEVC